MKTFSEIMLLIYQISLLIMSINAKKTQKFDDKYIRMLDFLIALIPIAMFIIIALGK